MGERFELEVPIRVQSEANLREHWAPKAKRAKKQRELVSLLWAVEDMPRRKPRRIVLTRIAPRMLDLDNCIGGFKHVRDQIATLCGFDDADASVEWLYLQEKRPKSYAVRIVLEFTKGDEP